MRVSIPALQYVQSLPRFRDTRLSDLHALEGVTNLNNEVFTLRSDGETFFVRLGSDRSRHFGIRRQDEKEAMQAAADQGLAPPVVDFRENGDFVTRWIEGRHWSREDFSKPGHLERLAALVHAMRQVRLPEGLSAPMISRLEQMTSSARTLGCALPKNIDDILHACRSICSTPSDLPLFLNHNDFWPNNFIDDGHKLWLIDFEFSGTGPGLHDLHTLLLSSGYEGEEKQTFIELCGFETEWVEPRLAGYPIVVHAFEGLWAILQDGLRGSSAVDYGGMARSHFNSIDAFISDERMRH